MPNFFRNQFYSIGDVVTKGTISIHKYIKHIKAEQKKVGSKIETNDTNFITYGTFWNFLENIAF